MWTPLKGTGNKNSTLGGSNPHMNTCAHMNTANACYLYMVQFAPGYNDISIYSVVGKQCDIMVVLIVGQSIMLFLHDTIRLKIISYYLPRLLLPIHVITLPIFKFNVCMLPQSSPLHGLPLGRLLNSPWSWFMFGQSIWIQLSPRNRPQCWQVGCELRIATNWLVRHTRERWAGSLDEWMDG